METITIHVLRSDVYEEVAKATDYTGSKLIDSDETARDRILAGDDDLIVLERFWEEAMLGVNECFKQILVSGVMEQVQGSMAYKADIEVSKSFDKILTPSVQSTLRSYFIASIIGQWFKFANKSEAKDYFTQAAVMLEAAERLLYSRRKPTRPTS